MSFLQRSRGSKSFKMMVTGIIAAIIGMYFTQEVPGVGGEMVEQSFVSVKEGAAGIILLVMQMFVRDTTAKALEK